MADPLYELLTPYFDSIDAPCRPLATDPTTTSYITRLTTLSLSDLTNTEVSSLAHSSQLLLRSLQALSKRSHNPIINATAQLSRLSSTLPLVFQSSSQLQDVLPNLESCATDFAEKYKRSSETENEALAHRRRALLLSQNADRISSILDLPTLLSTAISSSQPAPGFASTPGAASSSYASALDLHAHIKRLSALYPESPLIRNISSQAEKEMKLLTTALVGNLQSQGIKLAGAMRTIGWLRRVAPELDEQMQWQKRVGSMSKGLSGSALPTAGSSGGADSALGALFLVCRLAHLVTMLDALEPLRELADQETQARLAGERKPPPSSLKRRPSNQRDEGWSGGQQTERYLKRYIEIFREQSFAIISMYKSIFPTVLPVPGTEGDASQRPSGETVQLSSRFPGDRNNAHIPSSVGLGDSEPMLLPSPLATFPTHLVDLLFDTLRLYLPNVRDRTSRDSLLTQVLYCAGSLGRLGGDFSLMLALLNDAEGEEAEVRGPQDNASEWVEVMKKHRIQASRLELLASGVGAHSSRKESIPLQDSSRPVNT